MRKEEEERERSRFVALSLSLDQKLSKVAWKVSKIGSLPTLIKPLWGSVSHSKKGADVAWATEHVHGHIISRWGKIFNLYQRMWQLYACCRMRIYFYSLYYLWNNGQQNFTTPHESPSFSLLKRAKAASSLAIRSISCATYFRGFLYQDRSLA